MRYLVTFILFLSVCLAQTDVKIDSLRKVSSSKNNLGELREELNSIFNDPNFTNAFWGVSIQSLKTGETIFNLNADKLFKPASLLKLFTSSTGLLLLGSDYQFKTSFFTDGKISEGILYGNLFIIGGGDPTLTTGHNNEIQDCFIQWVDSLNQLGIYSIKGNVIAYSNHYEENKYGEGWLNEYESNWFAPSTGAFCLNNNSNEIILEPSNYKNIAEISFNPANINFEVYNKVITEKPNTPPAISTALKGNNVVQISGSIPDNKSEQVVYIPVDHPTQFFVSTFYETAVEEGLAITGFPISSEEQNEKYELDNLMYLFEYKSQPLSEIVTEIDKNSNNFCLSLLLFYSEQLLKTIGYELYGYGSTEKGIAAMKELLGKMGINPSNFNIADGSGLSTFKNYQTRHSYTNN